MDFGSVLHKAHRNETSKKEVRYYSTKFEPPKKVERNKKAMSVNIQKFLQKREAEEKQKNQVATKKRDELLALRAKDKKATRRVNVMLKRTKSASQSVLEEAVNTNNTAVSLAGAAQPDEDDYGYVSQEAAAYYNKMIEKYNKMPDDPKFPTNGRKVSTNLTSTKDRVRAALEREKEEALMPKTRKRKHKESTSQEEPVSPQEEEKEPERKKPKPKVNAPPPLNFADLLKIAERKQFEPIVIEKKEKDDERLLTKRQKLEQQKEDERVRAKYERQNGPSAGAAKPVNRIPKLNGDKASERATNGTLEDRPRKPESSMKSSGSASNFNGRKPDGERKVSFAMPNSKEQKRPSETNGSTSKLQQALTKPNGFSGKRPDLKPRDSLPKPTVSSGKPKEHPQRDLQKKSAPERAKQYSPSDRQKQYSPNDRHKQYSPNDRQNQYSPNDRQKVLTNDRHKQISNDRQKQTTNDRQKQTTNDRQKQMSSDRQKQLPNDRQKQLANDRPKQFPPSDLRPKQFPPRDLKPKQFSPGDVHRREFPPKKGPPANKRRILDDDDSEYDSELDDFIDDGQEEGDDYSKYISEIFGYDKSRYRDEEFDDSEMVSTFAQQMREECISAKMGIMEDLEDMKLEEEQKKRKMMMKKRRL